MRKKALRSRGKRLLALCVALCAMTSGCRGSQWPLWHAYQGRFIDAQGRVFDPVGDQRSTSEGEAYALFFALVANDRTSFDRILGWTQANLAQGDLGTHLPAWLWGKAADGSWKALDANPASDADVWLAYTLEEAGRLWKAPAYTSLGQRLAAQVAQKEVVDLPGFGPMLLPGPVGFAHGKSWTLNPSYLPVFVFERLARADAAGPWRAIADRIPLLVRQSARHGFAMDWVEYLPGDGFAPATLRGPAAVNQQNGASVGSYDAIRVYLWAGMLPEGAARKALLDALPGMSIYLTTHDAPPEKVSADGVPGEQSGPVGFSAALVPYLRAFSGVSKASAKQLIRMKSELNSSGLYGKNQAYYDQNLALFAAGFMEDRFTLGPGGELRVGWKH
jgi:endo-1,4-beta-D-glucanase Y